MASSFLNHEAKPIAGRLGRMVQVILRYCLSRFDDIDNNFFHPDHLFRSNKVILLQLTVQGEPLLLVTV
jgi:hypothetical protein